MVIRTSVVKLKKRTIEGVFVEVGGKPLRPLIVEEGFEKNEIEEGILTEVKQHSPHRPSQKKWEVAEKHGDVKTFTRREVMSLSLSLTLKEKYASRFRGRKDAPSLTFEDTLRLYQDIAAEYPKNGSITKLELKGILANVYGRKLHPESIRKQLKVVENYNILTFDKTMVYFKNAEDQVVFSDEREEPPLARAVHAKEPIPKFSITYNSEMLVVDAPLVGIHMILTYNERMVALPNIANFLKEIRDMVASASTAFIDESEEEE